MARGRFSLRLAHDHRQEGGEIRERQQMDHFPLCHTSSSTSRGRDPKGNRDKADKADKAKATEMSRRAGERRNYKNQGRENLER